MNYVFKGMLVKLITWPLWNIVLSLLVAGISWFAIVVLLQGHADFLEVWRTIYLWLLAILFVVDMVFPILFRCLLGWQHSKKYKVSFADAMEGMMEYRLYRKPDFESWTPEKFQEELSLRRMSKQLAEQIVKAMFDK